MSNEKTKRGLATWQTKNGTPQKLIFYSVDNMGIARLDFQLECIDQRVHIPDSFMLTDDTLLIPPVPRVCTLIRY